jgi:hypothetical protein
MHHSIASLVGMLVVLAACCGRAPMRGGIRPTVPNGSVPPDSGTSPMGDATASSVPPDKCEAIPQLPGGRTPVCTYAGGKPGRTGCPQFSVSVSMDSGSYYLAVNYSVVLDQSVVQCPRGKRDSSALESRSMYRGELKDTLSGEILDNGLMQFVCSTSNPKGPGGYDAVLCSDTGIQIYQPYKSSEVYLEFPGVGGDFGSAGYLGWIEMSAFNSRSDCSGLSIQYTSDSASNADLGTQPITCSTDNGIRTLSFKDVSGHLVTIALGGAGTCGISSVQWQQDRNP